ncbi:MAG: hypothetical protein KKB90_05290 [Actinobacteria bacterium]|nr:hypothetical protein [Actinomycetota bacterium]MCG2817787.1 acyl-CoA dehydratase activase-related protein [Actinomycetes bacterium]MBU4218361.1 hypothetical protein [Actinomycetota bacterium]MBU4359654.1 hypothetical protein [Actinomycetota bacterium]MBU4391911.1 hypothetical protein [Actinomycetota bacterium]
MRVGIPRALLFHHYGDCWLSFLEALGVEAVLSGPTSSDIVNAGVIHADNETCLPVKVFSGHLLELKDNADVILVPRVISQGYGTCSCPKFLGLPDMARALAPDLPPVLSPAMDLGDRRFLWLRDWYKVGRALGCGRLATAVAVRGLVESLKAHDVETGCESENDGALSVGVAGHFYNVNDPHVSLRMLERLQGMGARALTIEQSSEREARRQAASLPRKVYWGFERRLAGAVLHWSRTASVSGIIFLTSFACGPGSFIGALLEDELSREGSVPFMTITLDEHSAEAGLVTRLEAFTDMLRRVPARKPASAALERGAVL